MKILNFGSLNIDFVYSVNHIVQKGETISSSKLEIFTGGKGLNQSVALSRAGIDVYHGGAVGEDGQWLIDYLRASGVRTDYVEKFISVKTGNAIIQRDEQGDNSIILYGGANKRITKDMVDRILSNFSKGDIILLQNEISFLDYIIKSAHEKEMIIVLNPSPIDVDIFLAPLDYVDYFVLNEIEAKQILKMNLDDNISGRQLCKEIVDKYPNSKVVLTLGSEGSIYYDKEQFYQQKAYETQVVDTTGAGDTFTGYLVSGIVNKLPVKNAMVIASKAATLAVGKKGAADSIPFLEEVFAADF